MCSPCLSRPRSRSSKKSVPGQMVFLSHCAALVCGECFLCLCTLETQYVTITLLQAFTIMDQNRDGFIDKNDLRDTFAALGKTTCVCLHVSMSLLCCDISQTHQFVNILFVLFDVNITCLDCWSDKTSNARMPP